MSGYVTSIIAGMRMPGAACLRANLVRMSDRRAIYRHWTACLNMVSMATSVRWGEAFIRMAEVNG